MHYHTVARLLGMFAGIIGLTMIPSVLWAVYYHEHPALRALLLSILVSLAFGFLLWQAGRKNAGKVFQREAVALVVLTWIVAASLGALPFIFSHSLSVVDAVFESMSGFTTTGSSVMGAEYSIEALPRSILFWRSFTHWLGGIGIVMLFIAVLPYLGLGGKQLFKAETTGIHREGLAPRIQSSAKVLLIIYGILTVLQTAALMIVGMSFFDALCHAFGALGTGGYSTRNLSVAAYDSFAIELVIILSMISGATNFGIYFAMFKGDWLAPFRDLEWRVFILILCATTILIALNLLGMQWHMTSVPQTIEGVMQREYLGTFGAFRQAAFQVTSLMTNTGFITANFDTWPPFSRALLMTVMLLGGCAGSTCGGMKIIRLIVLVKIVVCRLRNAYNPKLAGVVRVGETVINDDAQRGVASFFILYVACIIFGTLAMSLLGLPLVSAMTSVVATLNTTGPGLGLVGPALDFHLVPGAGKLVLCLCMLVGRLEIFSVFVFLLPSFWFKN